MLDQDSACALFRKAWGLYDAIAEGNHMAHREIYGRVSSRLRDIFTGRSYQMLDLGSGNARFLAPCLTMTPPSHYCGVDLSATALEEARDRLAGLASVELRVEEMLQHLETEDARYHLVFSGFALHHLAAEAKQAFFHGCARRLQPGGRLLLVDIARAPGQSRQDYLQDYLRRIRDDWHGLSAVHKHEASMHVEAFDFPEALEDLDLMAQTAGFGCGERLEQHGPHHLMEYALPDPVPSDTRQLP